jgi:L-fuconolactonase
MTARRQWRNARRREVPVIPKEVDLPDFPLVDTHVHLYDPAAVRYPWMAEMPALNSRHGSAEFTAAIGGIAVDKLVFVEVDAAPAENFAELAWVADAADSDGRIQATVASIALERGKAVESEIAAYASMPLARNVRRLIQRHVGEPGWCLRPDFLEGIRLLGVHGLGFEICIFHPQMHDAIELVSRFPEISFVLDHLGKPGIREGLREPWRSQIRELASYPNVVVKISGAVTEADHAAWTYDQVAPYVAHAIDCFGFDRAMFGGDWPVMELATRYADWVALVDRVTAGASAADLRKLFRDTAIRAYRLPEGVTNQLGRA